MTDRQHPPVGKDSQALVLVADVSAVLVEFMPVAFPGRSAGEGPECSAGPHGVQDPRSPCVCGVVADGQSRRSALFYEP